MTEKTFTPDPRMKAVKDGKFLLYSLVGLLVAAMVIIVTLLTDVDQKYKESAEKATNFAHSLQLICAVEGLYDQYPLMCGDARLYIENPVSDQTNDIISTKGVNGVECEDEQVVLRYVNGNTEILNTTCG